MYWDKEKDAFMKSPDAEGIIRRYMDSRQVDRETAINDRVGYQFEPYSLKVNMPEKYIEKVIQKGEKIPKK